MRNIYIVKTIKCINISQEDYSECVLSIKINNDVQPKITASIKGSVFLKPKLNPEYDAVILLGPGVNAVTKPNIIRFSKSGYIIIYAISKPFSVF